MMDNDKKIPYCVCMACGAENKVGFKPLTRNQKWRIKNAERVKLYDLKRSDELSDKYVARSFFHENINNIPKELIDAKREQILNMRALKQLNEEIQLGVEK